MDPPYATESDFHKGIVQAMQRAQKNVFVDMVSDMVRAIPPHQIVLTYSDLASKEYFGSWRRGGGNFRLGVGRVLP